MNMIKDGGCCYDNIKQHCTDLTEQATAGLFYWTRAFFVASDVVGSHGRHLRGVGLKNGYLWVATSRNWMKSHRQFNWHAWSTNCINNQGGLWNGRPRFYTESSTVQNAFRHSVNTWPRQLWCTSLHQEYVNTTYTSFGMCTVLIFNRTASFMQYRSWFLGLKHSSSLILIHGHISLCIGKALSKLKWLKPLVGTFAQSQCSKLLFCGSLFNITSK